MKIVIILMICYMWYASIREAVIIERNMKKGIFVDGKKSHSLQHIAILLGGIAITIFPLFELELHYNMLIFVTWYIIIVLPHIRDERLDSK